MRGNHKHGHKKNGDVSPEYLTWLNMKSRCYNTRHNRYYRYGGRGIQVCSEWLNSFEQFLSDMGNKPDGMTLERINNDGHYEPENCRWATKSEQANNRHTNALIEHEGRKHTIAEWAKISGVPMGTLWHRIRVAKWSVDRALQQGVR